MNPFSLCRQTLSTSTTTRLSRKAATSASAASPVRRLQPFLPPTTTFTPATANFPPFGARTYAHASKMASRVHRVTMFKMPREEDRARMLDQYRKMKEDNQKDGKPYILSMSVGPAEADPRSQGYTLVSKTEFASLSDMRYYDESCPAHGAVKAFIKELQVDGILTVYFTPSVVGGTDP